MTDLDARLRALVVEPFSVPSPIDELRRRVYGRQRRRRRRRLVAGGIAMALAIGIIGWVATAIGDRESTVATTGPAASALPSKLAVFAAALVGPRAAWVLTDQGLYHSNDGGATWQDVSEPPEIKSFNGARAVAGWDFLDADHAWIATIGGAVNYTADGGHTWRGGALPGSPDYGAVQNVHLSFVSPSTGFKLVEMTHEPGAPGRTGIFETTDGGASWSMVNPAAPFDFDATITFTTPTTGWAAGSVSGLYRTIDGGRSWTAQQPGRYSDRQAAYGALRFFGADGVMEARLDDTTRTLILYATHDGGRTWARKSVPRDLDVSSYGSGVVPFEPVSSAHWLLAAGQRLFVTDDAGASWSVRHVPVRVSSLSFVDEAIGWAGTTASECRQAPPCPRNSALVGTSDMGRTWVPISLPIALTAYHDPVGNIALLYPASWHVAPPPVARSPGLPTQRRALVSIGTYPLRPGADRCAQLPVNSLGDLGPTDALLSIEESTGLDALTGIPPRPNRFGPMDGHVPSGLDRCLNSNRYTSRLLAFRDSGGSGPPGRVFYAFVALGPAASAQTQREIWNVLDSFQASA